MIPQAVSRVIGYTRVSTEEQARGGVSLADQAEKVTLYARLHGLELVGIEVDAGASAKSLDRPAFARVLARLDSGEVSGLVVAKLDRLTRSVGDLARLLDGYFGESAGNDLFSVGDSIDTRTAAGRLVLNVLMSVSQWEREAIVERTRSALAFKRSRGERTGTIPFGSALGPDGKTLIEAAEEAEALTAMQLLRSEGLSLRAIAARLDDALVPSRSGRPWSASSVRLLLLRFAPNPFTETPPCLPGPASPDVPSSPSLNSSEASSNAGA